MKELLSKINEAMQETLVGNYIFSDEELTQMYGFVGELLRNYDHNYGSCISQEYDQLVFVAMVNATKTWKSDEDTFWESIYSHISGNYGSPRIYNYLTSVIERLGNHGKIMYLSGCTKRYYATILAHAFAPFNSIKSFLELCWTLYSEDMNFTYTKNDETFELVANELKKTFSNDKSLDDDFKLGSGVYSLRAGIKRMAIDSPKEMINFIEETILLLDGAFNGEVLSVDSYYNVLVRDWWLEKEKSFGLAKPKRKSYERAITDYTTIKPKYNYNGRQAVLTIPSIRLKSNFYDMPTLNIYRNGELVDQREMYTFGTGLTMATKELSLYVDNLVSEYDGALDCTLEIAHCDEVIYNSKSSLFRDYVLFRGQREISREECLPGNYILFSPKIEKFSFLPENIKKVPNEPYLYILQPQEGEMLQNSKRTTFFVFEHQKHDIKIIANKKTNAKFIYNGEEYSVVDGDLKVIVKSDMDVTNYGVRYEHFSKKLEDFRCDKNEEYKVFYITQSLNVCQPQKINIFNYSNNTIESSYSVVKFNNINITYDKQLYFDNDCKGIVKFRTEKYDKSVSFDVKQGDIIIPFDDGQVILTPPVLKWKIGNENFHMQYSESLWYKNYSNSSELVIDLPTEMGYQVFLSNNKVLSESASFNSFKLGETVWSLLQDNTTELAVFVKVENVGIFPILKIYLKEKFIKPPFRIVENELIWDTRSIFVGEDKRKFKISFYNKNTVVHSWEISEIEDENYQTKHFTLPALKLGQYDITVDLQKREAFREVTRQIYKHQYSTGSKTTMEWMSKLKDKIRISKVILEDDTIKQQESFFIENFKFVCEKDNNPVFKGVMYHFFVNKKIYDDISPIYCMITADGECRLSSNETFSTEFFWKPGKMISLNSKDRKCIKKFIFIK